MKVDCPVQFSACKQILLSYAASFGIHIETWNRDGRCNLADSNATNFKTVEQPIQINMSRLYSRHVAITLHVVQPVCIELTRYYGGIDVLGMVRSQKVADVLGERRSNSRESRIHLRMPGSDDLGTPLFVTLLFPESAGDTLEYVAERAVSYVVQQCRQQDDSFAVSAVPLVDSAEYRFGDPPLSLTTSDEIKETAGRVIYSDTVGKPTVRRTRVYQIGKTQLPDAAQPLKLLGVQQVPCNTVRLIQIPALPFTEHDKAMDRIADPAGLQVLQVGVLKRTIEALTLSVTVGQHRGETMIQGRL